MNIIDSYNVEKCVVFSEIKTFLARFRRIESGLELRKN